MHDPTQELSEFLDIASKLPGFEHVTFRIRAMTYGMRTRIRKQLSEALAAIRSKTEEIDQLVEGFAATEAPASDGAEEQIVEIDAGDNPVKSVAAPGATKVFTLAERHTLNRAQDLNREIEVITADMVDPVYLRHCFVGFMPPEVSFKVSGRPIMGSEDLLERAPEMLTDEIITAIKQEAGVSPAVKESLKSPTTSGAVAGGQTSDMSAPDASTLDGGENVIARDSSQAK